MQLHLQPPAGDGLDLLHEAADVAGVEIPIRIGGGHLPAGRRALRGGAAGEGGRGQRGTGGKDVAAAEHGGSFPLEASLPRSFAAGRRAGKGGLGRRGAQPDVST